MAAASMLLEAEWASGVVWHDVFICVPNLVQTALTIPEIRMSFSKNDGYWNL